jgi:hypothetical protein
MTREDCNDVVSRAELLKIYEDGFIELQKIKHLKNNKGANDRQLGINWCINTLKDMPPVIPTQRWIPVSERLPEENGVYLATCDGEICGENEPFTGLAEYENGKWVDDEEDYQCVLAWMPLPEPMKVAEEVKAIPVERVEQAIEEIKSNKNTTSMLDCAKFYNNGLDMALVILDKLIEEVEDGK